MTRSNAPRNLNGKNPETKKYYFHVNGTVFFYPKDKGPEDIGSLQLGAIISNSTGYIPVSSLADAQRALSQAAVDRIGHENAIELVDVQISNMFKLGHMTPTEFHDIVEAAPAEPESFAPATVN